MKNFKDKQASIEIIRLTQTGRQIHTNRKLDRLVYCLLLPRQPYHYKLSGLSIILQPKQRHNKASVYLRGICTATEITIFPLTAGAGAATECAGPAAERCAPETEFACPDIERASPEIERAAPEVERSAPEVERSASTLRPWLPIPRFGYAYWQSCGPC